MTKESETISSDQVKGFCDGDRSRGRLTTSCLNNARHDSIGSQPQRFKLHEVYSKLSGRTFWIKVYTVGSSS